MNRFLLQSMFVTDLDGTLLNSDGKLTQTDKNALSELGQLGIVRVIATGRSLYSFKQAVGNDLPVDYIIFSTGAGIITFPEEHLIRNVQMDPSEVSDAVQTFLEFDLDFMVHFPIPDNHQFVFHVTDRNNPDFHRRLLRYEAFGQAFDGAHHQWESASQLLAVVNHDTIDTIWVALQKRLSGYSMIRSTSPLDGLSVWIEVFSDKVSKSKGVKWLADRLGIHRNQVAAVGNDYNDVDLLEWAGNSFLVANAPLSLTSRFHSVASHNHGGVSEEVYIWLMELDYLQHP